MTKKYELTTDSIMVRGRILYRIKALKDFSNVKEGDLGGYIQSEDNLSQEESAWVYNDAQIFGDARVYENAKVSDDAVISGNAHIFGDAKVFGNAFIYGDAKVFGNAYIHDNAVIYGDAQISNYVTIGNDLCISSGVWRINPLYIVGTENTVHTCSHNELRIGCMRRTVSGWKDQYREIGVKNGYTDGQIEEYKAIIDFAEQWLNLKFGGAQ